MTNFRNSNDFARNLNDFVTGSESGIVSAKSIIISTPANPFTYQDLGDGFYKSTSHTFSEGYEFLLDGMQDRTMQGFWVAFDETIFRRSPAFQDIEMQNFKVKCEANDRFYQLSNQNGEIFVETIAIEVKDLIVEFPKALRKIDLLEGGNDTQYFRGDKTWQTLDKASVGLSNVDNTSDLDKPISTATQQVINNVKGDAIYVNLDGTEILQDVLDSVIVQEQTIFVQGNSQLMTINLNVMHANKLIKIIGRSSLKDFKIHTLVISADTILHIENVTINNIICSGGLTLKNAKILQNILLETNNKNVEFIEVDYSEVPKQSFIFNHTNATSGGVLKINPDCKGFDVSPINYIENIYSSCNIAQAENYPTYITSSKNSKNRLTLYLHENQGTFMLDSQNVTDAMIEYCDIFQNFITTIENYEYNTIANSGNAKDCKIFIDQTGITIQEIKKWTIINDIKTDLDYEKLSNSNSILKIKDNSAYKNERLQNQSNVAGRYEFSMSSEMSNIIILPPLDVIDDENGLIVYLPNLLQSSKPSHYYDGEVYVVTLSKNNIIDTIKITSPMVQQDSYLPTFLTNTRVKITEFDKENGVLADSQGSIINANGDEYTLIEGVTNQDSSSLSFRWNDPNPSSLKLRKITWEII